jgi:hypothetical protein
LGGFKQFKGGGFAAIRRRRATIKRRSIIYCHQSQRLAAPLTPLSTPGPVVALRLLTEELETKTYTALPLPLGGVS